MKGKKTTFFDLKEQSAGTQEFAKAVLGPSGGLRAPTLRFGKTFVVGFGQPGWDEIFG